MVVFLRKGVAQALVHHLDRPIDSGNTPACTLYNESGTELQASTNCTKGPSTTLDGDAAAGLAQDLGDDSVRLFHQSQQQVLDIDLCV